MEDRERGMGHDTNPGKVEFCLDGGEVAFTLVRGPEDVELIRLERSVG